MIITILKGGNRLTFLSCMQYAVYIPGIVYIYREEIKNGLINPYHRRK